jgi:hypothetical protein
MKLEESRLSLGAVSAIVVAIVGVVVWALTFFAWADDTSAKFDKQEAYVQRLDEKLDRIHEDVLKVLQKLED